MLDLQSILKQGKRLDDLLARALGLVQQRPQNERYYTLEASALFRQSDLSVRTLVFNVPSGFSFRACRFALYPFVRLVSPNPSTQGPSEVTFRPTFWTWQSPNVATISQAIDCSVEFSLGARSLQNAPFSAAHTFSASAGYVANSPATRQNDVYSRMETVGGLQFDSDLLIKPGEVFVARLSPLFSAEIDTFAITDGRVFEYKILGVLEGTKVIL